MAVTAEQLQPLFAALLDAAFALATGAVLLTGTAPPVTLRRALQWSWAAFAVAWLGDWWAETAVMADAVSVDSLLQVLRQSQLGAMLELAGLAWLLLLPSALLDGGVPRLFCAVPGLALFAYARAASGHAADQGLWSVAVAMQALHLAAAAAWAGVVAVGAWCGLGWQGWSGADRAKLAQRASVVATVALITVLASGVLNAVRMLGVAEAPWHSPYIHLLGWKLAGVVVAASLGAWNRWRLLPGLRESNGRSFGRVLLIEAVVLTLVLFAAAELGAAMPPD